MASRIAYCSLRLAERRVLCRKAAEKGLRLRAGIDLESEEYAGRRVSRAAAFGESDDESGEDEEADGTQSVDQDLPNGIDER